MLLQVFFGQVFQVSLGESNICINADFLIIVGHFNILSEMSDFAIDFDSLSKEFSKVGSVENFILNGFGAVDAEGVGDFLFLGYLFTHGYY